MKKVILIFICLVIPNTNTDANIASNNLKKPKIIIYQYPLNIDENSSIDNLIKKLNTMEEKLNMLNEDLTKYYDSNK